MRRRLLYGFLILVVAIGVALVALKLYLASRLTPEVVTRLRTAFGVPVEISKAEVGLANGSALEDVRVYAPPPAPPPPGSTAPPARRDEEPWLRIARVEADVSILGFLRGA